MLTVTVYNDKVSISLQKICFIEKEEHRVIITAFPAIVNRYHGRLTIQHTGTTFSVTAALKVPVA